MNKFEPISKIATDKIEFLLERDGRIVKETRDKVIIKRMDQYAEVDKFGRVTWKSN